MTMPSDYKREKYIGRAIIINNETFNNEINNNFSKNDLKAIQEKLTKLGFHGVVIGEKKKKRFGDVTTVTDVKIKELKDAFRQVAQNDFTNYSCFVCVILSCGEPGVVYCQGEDGTSYEPCQLNDLQEPFKKDTCHRSLIGKPKVFLIQAYHYTEHTMALFDGRMPHHKIPSESDFLVHFSQQTESKEENKKGSQSDYVQALTEALERFCIHEDNSVGTLDFLRMLTYVHHLMIQHNEKSNIPLVTSTLRKRLYLQLSRYTSQ